MINTFSRWAACSLLLALPLTAQGPAPGFRLYAPHGTNDTWLIDNRGNQLHSWRASYNPGNGVYLDSDGTLVRTGQLAGAPMIGGRGGALQRLAFDGTILWDWTFGTSTGWAHHDIALLPNGNVLMIIWDLMTAAEAIAAGRNPATLGNNDWLPDGIIEVQQTGPTTGTIVWEWHIMDHVIQDFDNTKANFGVVANEPGKLDINFPDEVLDDGEWNHCNSIAYDPVNDLVVLSSPFQNEFWFIDHSTTTAEAAGSTGGNFGVGGDFVYRWGNPQAYRAGTAADQKLFFQHGTHIIPEGLPGAGNVLCFNNRAGTPLGMNFSTIVEIDIPSSFSLTPGSAYGPTNFVWEYMDPVPTSLYSGGLSNAERLPNGNTLVCSGRQAWLFEIDSSGQKVWEAFPPVPAAPGIIFQVSYYERYLWADQETMSASAGGTVDFDLVAGTANRTNAYLMMGSASGTSPGFSYGGQSIPLNPDGYLVTTLSLAGTALPSFFGMLDAKGNASASFTVPPIAGLAGLTLHHGYVVIDGAGNLTLASNPVPLTFN